MRGPLIGQNHVKLTYELLSIDKCQNLALDDGAGAISLFVGTTRCVTFCFALKVRNNY